MYSKKNYEQPLALCMILEGVIYCVFVFVYVNDVEVIKKLYIFDYVKVIQEPCPLNNAVNKILTTYIYILLKGNNIKI